MVATCLVFWTSSNLTSKVRGRGFLFNKYWWMSLSRRSLTHVKFCEPQHFVATRFKVTTMLYEEMLLVSFVFKQLMIWSIFVHCLPWYKKLPFPIWPVFATHDFREFTSLTSLCQTNPSFCCPLKLLQLSFLFLLFSLS